MAQIAQASPRIAQIDFMPVKANSNRFRACIARKRFGLLRAIVLYNERAL